MESLCIRNFALIYLQVLSLLPPSQSISFDLDIFVADGSYTLGVGNKTFLKSSDIFFRADKTIYSLKDGSLKFTSRQFSSGSDKHGNYDVVTNYYLAGNANVSTSFILYEDHDVVVFEQTYHNGAKGTKADTFNQTISGFPSFTVDSYDATLGYLSYDGFMAGDTRKHIGRWSTLTDAIGDGMKGGPLAVFDEEGRTFLLSPYSGFMASSSWHDSNKGGTVYWGIMGGVDEVPANYTYSTIIYYAEGINKAFGGWGDFLQKQYGEKEWYTWEDSTMIFLGYWTDNGSYYYFNTEPNKTYEQTMKELIQQEVTATGLPIGYVQYDSWWYYTGTENGLKTWEPRPDIFPDGLQYMFKTTNMPVALHSKYWSTDNTYAKQNGGKYDFLIDDLGALPLHQDFWTDLFNNASKWGMFLYEQDWLNGEHDRVEKLNTDLYLGEQWLTQMHDAAAKQYNAIQYNKANPRHVMQALTLPWVTQVRVSDDYYPGGEQWRIGVTSLFVGALGMRPFKDTFWTVKSQPGDSSGVTNGKTELYSALNAAVFTLSMGPVGPSDRVGAINATLLMRCCGEYGHIYKPDRPITAMDMQLKQKAFSQVDMELWWTRTQIRVNSTVIDVTWSWGVVLAVDTPTNLVLNKADLDFMGDGNDYGVFSYKDPGTFRLFDEKTGLTLSSCTKEDFCLYHFPPRITHSGHEVYLLGEMEKWTPVNRMRITGINYLEDDLLINIFGKYMSNITLHYVIDGKLQNSTCQIKNRLWNCVSLFSGKCIYDNFLESWEI